MQALGPQGGAILMAGQTVILLIIAFVGVRLLLAWPASAFGRRVAVLRTWPLTRGRFWSIFIPYLLVQAPILATYSVATASMNGQLAAMTPAQILGYSVLLGALAGCASLPLTAGLQAYFYKALGPVPEPGDGGAAGRS